MENCDSMREGDLFMEIVCIDLVELFNFVGR